MIKNFSDIANYFGASNDSETSVSRSIYKNTKCGAWIKFLYTDKKKVKEKVHVVLNPSFTGTDYVTVQSFKVGGRWNKESEKWVLPNLASKEIRLFLAMNEKDVDDNNIYGITWKEIVAGAKKESCPFVLHNNTTVISFMIEKEIEFERFGIEIGTIVEGADAEPETKVLYFPFSEQKLNDAILELECEADEIWQEWNTPNIKSWQTGEEND